MMHDVNIKSMKKSSLFFIFFIGLLSLFYTGCSSSNSQNKGNISLEHNISGKVQKGNFIDGTLTAQRVEENGSVFGEIVNVPIDNKAQYVLNLSWKGLTLLTAKGNFFNEYTGKNSTEEVELYALVNLGEKELSKKINLNLFTSLESQRIIELMGKGSSYNEALLQSKADLESIVRLSKDVNATALDMYDINSSLKKENLNLLLFSGTLLKIIEEKKQSNKGSQFQKQFKLQDMIQRFYHDFKKNGKFNEKSKDDFKKMIEEDKDKILEKLERNLHLNLNNNRDLLRDYEWHTPVKDTNTTFNITDFSLYSVILNGVNKNYNNEPIVYIGSFSDNLKFKFRITRNDTAQAYTYTVYAIAGTQSKVVKENIHVGKNFTSKVVELEVDSDLKEFFREAYSRGDDVVFKAVTNIFKTTISFVSKKSNVLPKFAELSDKLKVNNTLVDILSATYNRKLNSSCNEIVGNIDGSNIQYAQFNMNINWQPSSSWNDVNGSIIHGCIELVYNSSNSHYDATLKGSEIRFPNGTFIAKDSASSKFLAILNSASREVHINSNGNFVGDSMQTFLVLSNGTTMHYQSTIDGKKLPIAPEAQRYFITSLSNPNISDDWDNLSITLIKDLNSNNILTPYIHTNNLPFYMNLENSEVKLNSEELKFTNVSAKYINNNKDTSNDIIFSNPIGKFNVTINENGLQTETPIHFGAVTDAKTHFPYTAMSQSAFDVTIIPQEKQTIFKKV